MVLKKKDRLFLTSISELKQCFPLSNFRNKRIDIQKTNALFFPLKKMSVNAVFNCCHYFEHLSSTQRRLHQEFTTV